MEIEEFLITNNIKNSSVLASMLGCSRATISKRQAKGWLVDYYTVNGELILGWLKPDGVLFFEGYQ